MKYTNVAEYMQKKSHSIKEWLIAVRPWSFPASGMPVIAFTAYLMWKGFNPDWLMALWALATIIIFHAAGNTWSDYMDFKHEVDNRDSLGCTNITSGTFSPEEIKRLSLILMVAGCISGIAMLIMTGLPLLWIGIGGLLCAILYPAMKYIALGDIVIMLAYSILPALGTSFVTTGEFIWELLWACVPMGLITVAILHANNIRDIATDRLANIKTFAMRIGIVPSIYLYDFEVIVPFVFTLVCAILHIYPFWSLIVFLTFYPALKNCKIAHRFKREGREIISTLDIRTAKLQLTFGMLFVISLLIAAFTA